MKPFKFFDGALGADVTLKSASYTEVDSDYGLYETTYTTSTVKALVVEATENDLREAFGVVDVGETESLARNISAIAYVYGDVSVKEDDQIVYDGITYDVVKIKTFYYRGEIIYKKLWLSERS